MPTVLIDADGCPVVNCALRICQQLQIPVLILCDTAHQIQREGAQTLVFDKGADSVDFALVNRVRPGDIVITQDYGLASMCLARRARVLNQNGWSTPRTTSTCCLTGAGRTKSCFGRASIPKGLPNAPGNRMRNLPGYLNPSCGSVLYLKNKKSGFPHLCGESRIFFYLFSIRKSFMPYFCGSASRSHTPVRSTDNIQPNSRESSSRVVFPRDRNGKESVSQSPYPRFA